MPAMVLPQPVEVRPSGGSAMRSAVAILIGLWLLLVLSSAAAGAFVGPPRTPPLAIGIGVAAPLMVFFAWLRLSGNFRAFVLALDIRLIAAMQAWRCAGLGLLALYAHKVLPAVFALPAGLGDMAIGITAPWMMLALVREPAFAARGTFIRWNVLGILDLLIAIGLGTVCAYLATGAPGEISTAPMARLPLVLIPAFLVPLFLMLHIAALLQSRSLLRNRLTGAAPIK